MRPEDSRSSSFSLSPEHRAALLRAATQARRWLRAHRAGADWDPAGDAPPMVLLAGADREAAQRAAQQLARTLDRELYRVVVGSVVSKFMVETEKNLRRVLETAERTGAVLLLDEGDALFGKRTDVRDGHDRFANADLAYLEQRLAEFPGVAVLACRRPLPELGAGTERFGCVIELQADSSQH